jgi:hypothetical protein
MPADFDPARILAVLERHGAEVIVIGGLAAWMHGAAVVTTDVDVVFDRDPDNIRRVVSALREIRALYRDPAGRRIEPNESGLAASTGGGHHLLTTDAGDLDVLRDASGFGYKELLPDSHWMDLDGVRARFASLPRIIELKTRAGRPKDLAALPVLRAALEDVES